MSNKTYQLLTILAAIMLAFSCTPPQKKYKYTYESDASDPYGTLAYTLDNGLKIYMTVNKKEPKIFTQIAVKTGSKNDPKSATGLAHYLEHMLFKGTGKIGALNWKKEAPLLDEIEALYEKLRATSDEKQRKVIYSRIDSISYIASQYVATNEYDKMIKALGGQGTNAYTSTDQTVYINTIPSNELEKWMTIEGERFREVVLRLFHTELEAVYEEYNRGLDNDNWQAYKAMIQALYKKHTYGTQTTIGTAEHLKSPSITKIKEYFDHYYVANNMAVILSGDLDPDKTVDLVKKHFGELPAKEVTQFTAVEEEMTAPEYRTVTGPNAANVAIGYRVPGAKDAAFTAKLNVLAFMLNNNQAGLIDLNLNQKQKVLYAYSYTDLNTDYSNLILGASPLQGQSLKEAENLLLEQVEKIKKGDFEDWLVTASVKNIKLGIIQGATNNKTLGGAALETFLRGHSIHESAATLKLISGLTKKDMVAFANENFKKNYAVVYKEQGPTSKQKFEKPEITPVQVNNSSQSAYFAMIDSIKVARLKPQFLDFNKLIKENSLNNGLSLSYIKNEHNQLFNLDYIFDMGSYNDRELALAVEYLEYLGTSRYSPEELKIEFFKKGLEFNVSAGSERIHVTLSGLEESLEDGIGLFEHILAEVSADKEAYQGLVSRIAKSMMDRTTNKRALLFSGLRNYAQYGKNSPMRNEMTYSELTAIQPEKLTEKIKKLESFKHRLFYYGKKPMAEIAKLLEAKHPVKSAADLKDYPPKKQFKEKDINQSAVYYVDFDMAQVELLMLSDDKTFDKALMAANQLFNDYYGSIVFQDIRESKALAYSVGTWYRQGREKGKKNYINAYIGTQVDKLPEAVEAVTALLTTMPESEQQFDAAKFSSLKSIESRRVVGQGIFWTHEALKKLGFDYDVNKDIYSQLETMKLSDVRAFFDSHIKGKTYNYLVIGKRSKVNFDALRKLGKVKELSVKDLFGYDKNSLTKQLAI